jgi:uncharacterized protein (DUF58 family)
MVKNFNIKRKGSFMRWNVRKMTGTISDKRWRIVIRIAGFLGGMALLNPSAFVIADGGPMKKPQVPIALQFGTEGTVAVGSEVTVTLTVTPLVSSESVTVSMTLPDGLRLVDGNTTWTGTLEKGQSHVLTIQVRPEQAASLEVKAKAALTMANGSQMSRHAILTLDLNPNQLKSQPRERPGPRGNSILEIPAESRPKTK